MVLHPFKASYKNVCPCLCNENNSLPLMGRFAYKAFALEKDGKACILKKASTVGWTTHTYLLLVAPIWARRIRNLWRQSRHLDRMNPYNITNISLGCLFSLKLLVSAYNGFNCVSTTGDSLWVLLIASGSFYIGKLPFAQYFTGQKTITNKSLFTRKTP